MEPKDNCSFSYNSGKKLRRMGQEIQGFTPSSGLRVVGNVFSDWVTPYYDSFGLSVVNDKSNGTLIEGNDLRATMVGTAWGAADGGGTHRFGFGIEAGGNGIVVRNNILVGNWIAGVCASTPATVQNNQKFGPANWGDWTVEAAGKLTAANNAVDRNVANAPPLSAVVPATQAGIDAATSFQLSAQPIDSSTALLSWTNPPSGRIVVNAISTVGREIGPSVGPTNFAVMSSPMTIGGLHPGWQIDLQLLSDNGTASNVATIQMPNAPATPASATPTPAASVVAVDTVLHMSDGTIRTSTTQP
ncbi:MAG: hypothetical protein JO353_01150 [Phycisphaerae bacterium]|nr:hypothetical protein [Phycisphaerae bacterium]